MSGALARAGLAKPWFRRPRSEDQPEVPVGSMGSGIHARDAIALARKRRLLEQWVSDDFDRTHQSPQPGRHMLRAVGKFGSAGSYCRNPRSLGRQAEANG
jgi:hypothetical protein